MSEWAEDSVVGKHLPRLVDYDIAFEQGRQSPALSFLVREYVTGLSWLDKPSGDTGMLQRDAALLDQMLTGWEERGCFLGDLKPEHLIEDERGYLRLIDLAGVVPLGAQAYTYTPGFDRRTWGLGDGIATPEDYEFIRTLLLFYRWKGRLPLWQRGGLAYEEARSALARFLNSFSPEGKGIGYVEG